jgi:hypothetical protein
MSNNAKGQAIASARELLKAGNCTVKAIAEAVQALCASGAMLEPEGMRMLGELSAAGQIAERAETLHEFLAEADILRLRHESERDQLLSRARAVLPDVSAAELFGKTGRKAEPSAGSGESKAGLPSGLYRHADGREYRNDAGKQGRRPDWLKLELRVGG